MHVIISTKIRTPQTVHTGKPVFKHIYIRGRLVNIKTDIRIW